MFSNFDATFRPWKRLVDKKVSDMNPCMKCDIHKEWMNRAIYGSPAEREEAVIEGTGGKCKGCIDKVLWEADCFTKLKWYEDNDECLKGAKNVSEEP